MRHTKAAVVVALVTLLGFIDNSVGQEASTVDAETEPAMAACSDESCAISHAQSLLRAERYEEAISCLTEYLPTFPESGPIQTLLGVAYFESGQPLWAVDSLARRLQQDVSDCEARSWLAWVFFQDSALPETQELLQSDDCVDGGPMAARFFALRSLLATSQLESELAETELENARGQDSAFDSDRDAIQTLSWLLFPNRLQELTWRIVAGGGYATNALMGSPTDPEHEQLDVESGLIQTDGWIQYVPDFGALFRPLVEAQLKVLRYVATDAEDFSFFSVSGGVGFYMDWGLPRVRFGYRPEWLLLAGGDQFSEGPIWFYSAHRGEIEAEITPWLMSFVGGGLRDFREMGRTRYELDGGLGGQSLLVDNLVFLWALAGRGYWAQTPAYDLWGATAVANLRYAFPHGWSVRGGVTLALDRYPDSAGHFADQAREEEFIRAGVLARSAPFLDSLRFELSYDYSDRASTVPDYAFSDHRIILRLNWSGVMDLGLPSTASDPPLADIDWGLQSGDEGPGERIQDLLRQDEQVNQSCGCIE